MTEMRFIDPGNLHQDTRDIGPTYREARSHLSDAYPMETVCAVCDNTWGDHRGLLCPASMVEGMPSFPDEGMRFTTFEAAT